MAVVIRPSRNERDRRACYAVRIAVFVEEQKVPLEEEIDAEDEKAWHFVVEDAGRVVGTARLVAKGDGVGKIGRVALLPEYRGRGIGRDLMGYVMDAGFRHFETLILDAQIRVIPFYEKLGFKAEGDVFLDAGIEHRRMVCSREGIKRRQSR